jgi:hypothetical protein
VQLGDVVGEKLRFGEMEDDGQLFSYARSDGGLGLGLPTRDEEIGMSIVENLAERGVIDEAVFSLFLGEGNNTRDSELVLGGVDEEHFTGRLMEFPVPDDAIHWEVKIDGIAYGIHEIALNDTRAEFDSMSTLIGLPESVAAFL